VTRTYQIALTAGTTYAFGLSYFEDGSGGGQISLSATGPPAPPSTLLTLNGSTSNGNVVLNWNSDPAAAYYVVYRAPQGATSYSFFAEPSTNSSVDTSGTPGVSYYYLVYAYDSAGNHGPVSNYVLIQYPAPVPAAPTGLTATPGNPSVALAWTAPSGSPTSYNIKRSLTTGGPYTLVDRTAATSYTDIYVTNRTKYYYVVTAVNASGEGPNSNEVAATPAAPDDAQFVSQSAPPPTIRVGQSYPVTVTMMNVGTSTWTRGPYTSGTNIGQFQLLSMNPFNNGTWGTHLINLPDSASIAPGQSFTFTFTAVAPTTPGSYNFQWQMIDQHVGVFGDLTPNVVCSNAADDAQFVSQSAPPATIRVGQSYPVTVTMMNVGTSTWTRGPYTAGTNLGQFQLLAVNPFNNGTWGTHLINMADDASIAPGQSVTFTFTAVAPATPGSYNFQWQMIDQHVGVFGDVSPQTIQVNATPDFTIDLDTSAITLSLTTGSVPGGGPSESIVTAVPLNGFTGTITLSLSWLDAAGNSYSGSPGGINYWFDPAADYDPSTGLISIVDSNSQISTFSICPCQGNPPPGTYTLVITGTTATLSHSIKVPITITN
jgi:hypothetical protein